MCKSLILAMFLTAGPGFAFAQVSPGGMLAWGRSPLAGGTLGAHRAPGMHLHRRTFSPNPYFWGDPFYYSTEEPGLPTAAPAVSRRVVPDLASGPPPEPLLIEWNGDRFVRSGGDASQRDLDYSVSRSKPQSSLIRPDLPPAILVYRDGHQRQISDYVISAGVLYTRGDYLSTGVWTEAIQLSSLDLTATLRVSQQHGANFVLPNGPHEVVTRP